MGSIKNIFSKLLDPANITKTREGPGFQLNHIIDPLGTIPQPQQPIMPATAPDIAAKKKAAMVAETKKRKLRNYAKLKSHEDRRKNIMVTESELEDFK